MKKVYVIKVISSKGRGYLVEHTQGAAIVSQAVHATTFDTFESATFYIRNNRIENKDTKAYVVDTETLIDEKEIKLTFVDPEADVYYVENENGQKLFHDGTIFYFDNREVGWCCWNTKDDIKDILENAKLPFKWEIKKMKDRK